MSDIFVSKKLSSETLIRDLKLLFHSLPASLTGRGQEPPKSVCRR